MKNARINIPHFRFILSNVKIFGEMVTPKNKIISYISVLSLLLLVYKAAMLQGLLQFVEKILTEAWDYEPEARITARCIYERFNQLRNACVITDVNDDETKQADDIIDDETKLLEKTKNERIILPANDIISTVV